MLANCCHKGLQFRMRMPLCPSESLSYEFGPGRGLITYAFPEERRPEMKSDVIALGFITTKDDAILLRVDSATSQDYMELEIVRDRQTVNSHFQICAHYVDN